jgi:hypothetical protein
MIRRPIAHLLMAAFGLAALGCGESNSGSSPTSPELATSTATCDLSTARGLVSSIFASSQRTPARNLLQAIQNAGSGTAAATDAGFDLFGLLAANGTGSASDRSTFVNAIIPCQKVGDVALPIDFSAAFGANGAFEVRGNSATDNTAAVSHDVLWGLEPPLAGSPLTKQTWNAITTAVPSTPAVTTKRFLAYGYPVTPAGFTNETQVGTIFEWFTIPKLTFSPGVVVGTCINDGSGSEYLIQHNAVGNGGDIVPSATPSFCPATLSGLVQNQGWSLLAVAHRVVDFFKPQPLLAAALATRPPGGSLGALSPSAAINPGQITLSYGGKQIADGKTNQQIQFTDGTTVTVSVTPAGSTPMDGVRVRLIATSNLGATVVPNGNTAVTQNGVATFPTLSLNKAGGYRLIATLDGFGQNNASGFNFSNVTSNGFNLKQTK